MRPIHLSMYKFLLYLSFLLLGCVLHVWPLFIHLFVPIGLLCPGTTKGKGGVFMTGGGGRECQRYYVCLELLWMGIPFAKRDTRLEDWVRTRYAGETDSPKHETKGLLPTTFTEGESRCRRRWVPGNISSQEDRRGREVEEVYGRTGSDPETRNQHRLGSGNSINGRIEDLIWDGAGPTIEGGG